MTSFRFDPDDPRQVRALEAAAYARAAVAGYTPGAWPMLDWPRLLERYAPHVEAILDAYFSALQTEGVVLVAAPSEPESICGLGLAMRGHGWITCSKPYGHEGRCGR